MPGLVLLELCLYNMSRNYLIGLVKTDDRQLLQLFHSQHSRIVFEALVSSRYERSRICFSGVTELI